MRSAIQWFSEIGIADHPLVGGKNASLGEMDWALLAQGVRVPHGFATTADATRLVLSSTGLAEKIRGLLRALDTRAIENRRLRGSRVAEASGNFGWNALTNEDGDLVEMGVLDPCKVTRTALQNAASTAGLALTTECMIAQGTEEKRRKTPGNRRT